MAAVVETPRTFALESSPLNQPGSELSGLLACALHYLDGSLLDKLHHLRDFIDSSFESSNEESNPELYELLDIIYYFCVFFHFNESYGYSDMDYLYNNKWNHNPMYFGMGHIRRQICYTHEKSIYNISEIIERFELFDEYFLRMGESIIECCDGKTSNQLMTERYRYVKDYSKTLNEFITDIDRLFDLICPPRPKK